jgi:putative membrane protein
VTTTPTPPLDPGLQPERTNLAWRRTALSLLVWSLAALRILPAIFGWWAASIALVGMAFSIVAFVTARRRYSQQSNMLALSNDSSSRVGAAVIAGAAALAATLGIMALLIVIAR